MRIGTSAALAALWAFVLLWGTGGVLGQDNAGSGLIAPLGLGTNPDANVEVSVTDGDLLSVEEPIEGVVGKGQAKRLHINLPANLTEYPSILISLRTTNDEGDADVACVPGPRITAEGLLNTLWASNHSEGVDYVFISREQEMYERAKTLLNTQEATDVPGVIFQCAVTGHATEGTNFILEVDVIYQPVNLIEWEQAAMQQIYDRCCKSNPTTCPGWKSTVESSGKLDMDFCHFPSSICNADGQLVRLNLRGQGLQCEFPSSEIAKLKFLEKLEMDDNELMGDIGEITQSLAAGNKFLQFISLSDNILSGTLHEESLCKLAHGPLLFLNFRENDIEGKIPACLFDETSSVKEAFLGSTKVDGQLPAIPVTSKIQVLSVEATGLSGPLDPSLGILENLVTLDLSENALSGTLPSTFGSSKRLVRLDLRENDIKGTIPGAVATSTSLQYVHFENNLFTGLTDEWYTGDMSLSKITLLDMSNNEIEGTFPAALTRAQKLLVLNMEANKLSGPLPDQLDMFPWLLRFDVRGNRLNGELPKALSGIAFFNEEMVHRTLIFMKPSDELAPMLDLSMNEFSGPIPDFLSKERVPVPVQSMLFLGGNRLESTCPVAPEYDYISDLVCDAAVTPGASTNQEAIITAQPVGSDGHLAASASQISDDDLSLAGVPGEGAGTGRDVKPEENPKAHKKVKRSAINGVAGIIGIAILCALVIFIVVMTVVQRKRRLKREKIDDLVGDVELGGNTNGAS